jgi:hypothetical protein
MEEVMPPKNKVPVDHSAAWVVQSQVSVALSMTALGIGIAYLPVDPWMRAFLAVTALWSLSAVVSLTKTLRDRHEAQSVLARVDEVKLERFLAEHDPFKPDV